MKKATGRQELPMTPEAVHARIWAIDLKTMGSMSAGEFGYLCKEAVYEDRRHLDWLLSQFQLEKTVRRIVNDEIEKQNPRKGKKGT